MWQEARKQEKQIKTMLVDYKKRAERRRDYYERIKQDPIKFLRVYGRPSKLHVDSEVVKAAENPNIMMPWIGDPGILIDRFDVRANLEHLDNGEQEEPKLTPVERIENRLCMYERYRCLIHNDYAGVTEAMCLKQIEIDEKYGDTDRKRKEEEEASKKSHEPKAAIGFNYEDSHPPTTMHSVVQPAAVPELSDSEDDEADSDMDIDVELDLATLGMEGRRQLAASAANYGLHPTDFVRLLNADQQLETELRLAKALEEEKLQLAGRKSRRARRLLKERRVREKGPKLITTKVGLLNGQPITRRTVYLSASSSDSGDYPSDECEEQVDRTHLRRSKPTADVRARRARAKPLLTNARGPSVMIGGMTSIGLCRRRHNRGLDPSEKMRKAGARSSSSSSRASSSSFSRRSGSTSSSDRSPSSRRRRRSSSGQPTKRSRVEYITTFGADDDDEGNRSRSFMGASSAVSAVAASAVSRVLGCRKRPSPAHSGSSSRRDSKPRSPGHHGSYRHRSSLRDSSDERLRSRRRSSTESSRSHDRSTGSRTRGSPRKSTSRSPLSQRLATSSSTFGNNGKRSPPGSPSSRLYEAGGANPPRRDDPSVVRKRYYRPELESDEQSCLSTDDESDQDARTDRVTERRPREAPYSRRSGTGPHEGSAGKMTSQSAPVAVTTKLDVGSTTGGVRLTPQELLKRRVQSQLTKAFIADKKAEQEKQVQLEQERQAREEGLRRQARLLRQQEEKRLREEQQALASDNSSDSSTSSGPTDSAKKNVKDTKTTSSSDGKSSPKASSAVRGSVSQRARLSSNLTTGYHFRDFDYPSPDRHTIRSRYGASPDRSDNRSSRNPQSRSRPGDHSWHSSSYDNRSSSYRDSSSGHRFGRGNERTYSRYGGDRNRYS